MLYVLFFPLRGSKADFVSRAGVLCLNEISAGCQYAVLALCSFNRLTFSR